MSEIREALLGIAIGKKGVGKTYATLDTISDYLTGFNGRFKPRKVLILDVNNEYGDVKNTHKNPKFPHIKAIALQDIKKFTHSSKVEARRVSVIKPDGTKMNLKELQDALKIILDNYKYGCLIIEDINKFISDSLPTDLIGSIVTQRHMSVDVITHYQTIGKALHPKIWGNCNYIRWHKCEDFVAMQKSEFRIPQLFIIEKLVAMQFEKGNRRFYAYYDKDYAKIKGQFTKHTFRMAIEEYLKDNYSIVEKEVNRKDLFNGKKIHKDQKSAVEHLINQYITEYYGNEA